MSADTPENSELTEDDVRSIIRDELNNAGEDTEKDEETATRRDFAKAALLGGATLATGTGVGAVGYKEAVEPARAAPDESDVGVPSAPVDAYLSNVYGPHGSVDFQDPINVDELSNTVYFSANYGSDGAAIQQAMDALGSSPGTVVVNQISNPPYVVSNAVTVPNNTRVIIAEDVQGDGTTDDNVFQSNGYPSDTTTLGTKAQNIHFVGAGGVIDGNRQDGTRASGLYHNCIAIYGEHCSVRYTRTKSADWHCIQFYGGEDLTAVGNYCSNCRGSTIQLHYNEGGPETVKDATVRDNHVNGGDQVAIYLSGVESATITGNTADSVNGGGVTLYDGDAGVNLTNITANGNVIDSVSADGVKLLNDNGSTIKNLTIADNDIVSPGGHGVNIVGAVSSDLAIEGNTIDTPSSGGVWFNDNGNARSDVKISGNTITDYGMDAIQPAVVTNLKIVGNDILNAVNSDPGIYVISSNSDPLLIAENTVVGAGNSGVIVDVSRARVEENTVKNSANHGIEFFADHTDSTIKGNVCYDDQATKTQDYGINMRTGTDYNAITGNQLRGNVNTGVNGAGANSAVANNIT